MYNKALRVMLTRNESDVGFWWEPGGTETLSFERIFLSISCFPALHS